MAKSKRSKVKMAYKAMRRRVMEPLNDAKLRGQAEKVYTAIGLPLPTERKPEDAMPSRTHGGSVVVTNFFPTEQGPKLNCVHGPLAHQDPLLRMEAPVVGLPEVGAGLAARLHSETPAEEDDSGRRSMEVAESGNANCYSTEVDRTPDKPYFYPRRAKCTSGISKGKSKKSTRHPQNKPGVAFI